MNETLIVVIEDWFIWTIEHMDIVQTIAIDYEAWVRSHLS